MAYFKDLMPAVYGAFRTPFIVWGRELSSGFTAFMDGFSGFLADASGFIPEKTLSFIALCIALMVLLAFIKFFRR